MNARVAGDLVEEKVLCCAVAATVRTSGQLERHVCGRVLGRGVVFGERGVHGRVQLVLLLGVGQEHDHLLHEAHEAHEDGPIGRLAFHLHRVGVRVEWQVEQTLTLEQVVGRGHVVLAQIDRVLTEGGELARRLALDFVKQTLNK